jgi:membrane protease YdiL (CAAX protease family)
MWSLFIGIPARWVTYLVPNTTASSIGENARVLLVKPLSSYIVQSCDAGFFEELLFRVILLGGILAVLRYVHVPKQCAWMISIVVSALIFANVHTNEFGGIFMVDSFLYRSYLGFLLGIIYLWRGFGVAVWTHTLFDAFLYITFFLTATSV